MRVTRHPLRSVPSHLGNKSGRHPLRLSVGEVTTGNCRHGTIQPDFDLVLPPRAGISGIGSLVGCHFPSAITGGGRSCRDGASVQSLSRART